MKSATLEEANVSSRTAKLSAEELRQKIIRYLKLQGFYINPSLQPIETDKDSIRRIHEQKRHEQLSLHKKFLQTNLRLAKEFAKNTVDLDPARIDLQLLEIKPRSLEARLFFWWNLVWWSLPFDKPIGRQMRFILWDKGHDAPFGLIGLQSPPLKCSVRDRFLQIQGENTHFWVNQSMYAQRVGALPPYNDLLGGKMAALSLVSNEIRNAYSKKYNGRRTLMRKRIIPSNLLFITTSSAFGKSSMYERINYNGTKASYFIGFTSGAGTFHISETLYRELLLFLKQNDENVKLGYGTGSSRKLRLINKALRMLKIPNFTFHNIKRGYYFFPHAKNYREVIAKHEEPRFFDRPFKKLFEFWKSRWGLPRSQRLHKWKAFDYTKLFDKTSKLIEEL